MSVESDSDAYSEDKNRSRYKMKPQLLSSPAEQQKVKALEVC
jgi:hypothetical protein